MRVRILDQSWTLKFVPREEIRGDDGECSDPRTKGPLRIQIADDLEGRDLIETLIHEAIHAGDWFKDHEWVDPFAADLARLIWRCRTRWR